MKRSRIMVMSSACLLLILGSSLGHAKPPPRDVVRPAPAGTTQGQKLQVDDEDSPPCKTIDACNTLIARAQAKIAKLQSASLVWGDIVKKDSDSAQYCPDAKEGQVCTMNQYKAEQYCKGQNKRLPTAREQAQWSQANGAKGIQETASNLKDLSTDDDKVDAEIKAKKDAGYYTIYKKNNAGQVVVDFYFNESGYKRPSGDLGKYWFWSSSVFAGNADIAFGLNGNDGYVGGDFRSYVSGAVRCVVGR